MKMYSLIVLAKKIQILFIWSNSIFYLNKNFEINKAQL
jgi:hypothetical protein